MLDPTPTGLGEPFGPLSATDREICDAIRALQDKAAALEPTDPAIYAINDELNRMRQDLIVSRRSKGKRR